ncbi:ribosome biogenesis GTPase Der [Ichthyobacterium seriolicida]|uniref:GTPase Der n=1 Tax=Ichthyobacterium seriolicida TaxID=242600 RepID=A0A1J1DZJ5_9FLAO|nr:ribosome biogenesis GTPase Der [Ichthyobacterium seriolicida]BAV94093.1 GTP-binding protein EngA [Ichthyobacterium seriolicida]
MANIVAIVGRPNVGKSTFFNRLTKKRSAIVDSVSGVTRDRNYGKSDWNGREFSVIDTGGYVYGSDDVFEKEIREQVKLAIDEADVILFMVDIVGVTDMDKDVSNILRKSKKPVLLIVNKVDNSLQVMEAVDFYSLGFKSFHSISAINGSGTGDLLDEVVSYFSDKKDTEEDSAIPKIAVVGRPNAGKSSFINALIGENRNIVTDIAGTTRDSLGVKYNRFGQEFILIDTAGVRKKSKVNEDIEFYSVMRSIRSIEQSDICFHIVDATRGFEAQDQNIYHLIERNRKGAVILINKWDLVEKETNTIKHLEKEIREKIRPFDNVPIIFISSLTKQRIFKAIEEVSVVYENLRRKIKTNKLNEVMIPIIERTPPPVVKNKYIKIKFCNQLMTSTPKFVFFTNLPQYIKEPYKRFIENKLRDNFDFKGAPISIYFRKK